VASLIDDFLVGKGFGIPGGAIFGFDEIASMT